MLLHRHLQAAKQAAKQAAQQQTNIDAMAAKIKSKPSKTVPAKNVKKDQKGQ